MAIDTRNEAMTNQEAIDMLEALKAQMVQAIDDQIGTLSSQPPARGQARSNAWVLPDEAPTGGWTETGRSSGDTFRHPDAEVEEYAEVVRYRGTGDFAGIDLALGFNENGGVAGLVTGADGGLMRAPTYFFPAGDAATTNEKISMIRGGGPDGRSGFGPSDPVPPVYAGFKTEMLRDRIFGKWNRLGVVARADDHETMLTHTAIQAEARGAVHPR